jgi:hypothetical protein
MSLWHIFFFVPDGAFGGHTIAQTKIISEGLICRHIYSRIDYKFLIAGHTYGPTDRCFGVIEKYLDRIENVYTPQEWYDHVSHSTSTAKVVEMQQEYFRDYWSYLHHMYTDRNKDTSGQSIEFSKVVWFNFGIGEEIDDTCTTLYQKEHPTEVWLRYSYDPAEHPIEVSYLKKSNLQLNLCNLPPLLYSDYPLPTKPAKASDLKKLAIEYLPTCAKNICIDLPALQVDNEENNAI